MLRNFIFTIAINKVYNFYKQKALRGKHREIIAATTKQEQDSLYQKLYYNELQENLEAIIEQLPSQQKRIFKLSRFDGLLNKEIAEKLDISLRSVENQIYRALKFIKRKLPE